MLVLTNRLICVWSSYKINYMLVFIKITIIIITIISYNIELFIFSDVIQLVCRM